MEVTLCVSKSLQMLGTESPSPLTTITYSPVPSTVSSPNLTPEYASFLHNEGYSTDQKRFKLFTFSQLMAERRRITGDKIRFDSTLTWLVSSPVETFLSHFADTLLTEGGLTIGRHQLPIKDVTVPRIPRFRPEMRFRCLSPIVMSTVRERNGKQVMHYCLPDDPCVFGTHPSESHPQIPRHLRSSTVRRRALTFQFDENYINRKQGRVTRLVDFKGIQIRGILCPLRVSGSRELISIGLRMRVWG